jgi:hypothetical protein
LDSRTRDVTLVFVQMLAVNGPIGLVGLVNKTEGWGVVESLACSKSTYRPYCHSGIFFLWPKILRPIWRFLPVDLGRSRHQRLAWQQNLNKFSVLLIFGRVDELVALALLLKRLIFEALFFRATRVWFSEGYKKFDEQGPGPVA